MNSLTAIFLGAMLWLTGQASGDIAMVLTAGKEESLVIFQYEGAALQRIERSFTFTSGKVVIAEGGKQIGQVALTVDEQAEVDRYCEYVRNARRGTGNGANANGLKFTKNGKEPRAMGERHRIGLPEEANPVLLPLADFKKRAANEHQNSVENAGRGDGDKSSN